MADEDIKQGEFVIEYVGEGHNLLCFVGITCTFHYNNAFHLIDSFMKNCVSPMQLLTTKHARKGFGK